MVLVAMDKPASSVRCRYPLTRLSQRGVEPLIRARFRTTQSRFELGPTRFNRRQDGRIERQVLNLNSALLNRPGNPCDILPTQVVHHHHHARPESLPPDLLDIGTEFLTRRGPWNRHQLIETHRRKSLYYRHMMPGGSSAVRRWRADHCEPARTFSSTGTGHEAFVGDADRCRRAHRRAIASRLYERGAAEHQSSKQTAMREHGKG